MFVHLHVPELASLQDNVLILQVYQWFLISLQRSFVDFYMTCPDHLGGIGLEDSHVKWCIRPFRCGNAYTMEVA